MGLPWNVQCRGRSSGRREERGARAGIPQDTAWRLHAALSDWTGKADAKASFALTVQSAVLLGLAAGAGRGFGHARGLAAVLLWAGVAALVVGLACAVLAVAPSLRADVPGPAEERFVYFGHLRDWEPGALEYRLREADPLPALSRELVVMSRIAWRKHVCVRWSLVCAAAGTAGVGAAAALT
ncbi:Pycsar system effector family protein [Streptomyces sp. CA-181903]|uniref:Pycsar system effector family protein n=1 Tax=Streptomyces sp. CA-181903 TaxID=3240055 RepID=UPI003D9297C0